MPHKDPVERERYRRQWEKRQRATRKAEYRIRDQAANRIRYQRLRAYVHKAKNVPCTDCGVRYPYYVMQFDHLGDDKLFNLGGGLNRRRMSFTAVREEIAKCEVVCANCHAERTHQRREVGRATAAKARTALISASGQMELF